MDWRGLKQRRKNKQGKSPLYYHKTTPDTDFKNLQAFKFAETCFCVAKAFNFVLKRVWHLDNSTRSFGQNSPSDGPQNTLVYYTYVSKYVLRCNSICFVDVMWPLTLFEYLVFDIRPYFYDTIYSFCIRVLT